MKISVRGGNVFSVHEDGTFDLGCIKVSLGSFGVCVYELPCYSETVCRRAKQMKIRCSGVRIQCKLV